MMINLETWNTKRDSSIQQQVQTTYLINSNFLNRVVIIPDISIQMWIWDKEMMNINSQEESQKNTSKPLKDKSNNNTIKR